MDWKRLETDSRQALHIRRHEPEPLLEERLQVVPMRREDEGRRPLLEFVLGAELVRDRFDKGEPARRVRAAPDPLGEAPDEGVVEVPARREKSQ